MSNNILHFIWVGEPRQNNSTYFGQDVIGPVFFRRYYSNHELQPINFWCLTDHMKAFQTRFAQLNVSHIEIRSIQNYVATKAAANEQFENTIQLINNYIAFSTMRQSNQKDSARDLVTVKVLFQYFLQIWESGYFLDTNVFSLQPPSDLAALPEFNNFRFPFLELRYESAMVSEQSDPWIMYSPENSSLMYSPGEDTNNNCAYKRFQIYYKAANTTCYNVQNGYSEDDRKYLAHAFVRAAESTSSNIPFAGSYHFGDPFICIQELHLAKMYQNSHKNSDASPIRGLALKGYEQLLEYYIEALELDVNKILIDPTTGFETTLALEAVVHDNDRGLEMLVQRMSDVDIRRKVSGAYNETDLLTLAVFLRQQRCTEIIMHRSLALMPNISASLQELQFLYNIVHESSKISPYSASHQAYQFTSVDDFVQRATQPGIDAVAGKLAQLYLAGGPLSDNNKNTYISRLSEICYTKTAGSNHMMMRLAPFKPYKEKSIALLIERSINTYLSVSDQAASRVIP